MVASVPELTSRTISTDGRAETMTSASSTSARVGAPKRRPPSQSLLDGRHDGRMAMPQDVGSIAADVVDVAPAVLAFEVGPRGGADEHGLAPHAAEGAHGGIDATGENFFGAGEEAHRGTLPPGTLTPVPSPTALPPTGRGGPG